MASPSKQWNLPPMALQQVASAPATQGNSVASSTVTLVEVVNAAAAKLGYQHDQLGGIFGGLSVSEVTKCFGPNNPDRNRLMKQPLPMALAREIALAMCEATGLAVAGPDAERHALADVLESCANYVRVMSR